MAISKRQSVLRGLSLAIGVGFLCIDGYLFVEAAGSGLHTLGGGILAVSAMVGGIVGAIFTYLGWPATASERHDSIRLFLLQSGSMILGVFLLYFCVRYTPQATPFGQVILAGIFGVLLTCLAWPTNWSRIPALKKFNSWNVNPYHSAFLKALRGTSDDWQAFRKIANEGKKREE
jgi:Na+/melibiose symporter-like transporter